VEQKHGDGAKRCGYTAEKLYVKRISAAYLGLRNNQGHREGVRAPTKKHFHRPPRQGPSD